MKIDSRDLHGLRVATESGLHLGKVLAFEVDVESHSIVLYHVGQRNWIGGMPRYLIGPQNVVSITAEQVTVRDGSEKNVESQSSSVAAAVQKISPIATSQRE